MKQAIIIAALLTSLTAAAQDTYQSAALINKDLNGTARYVGMGGAMEALGADISTMGTNPAGIGLFRKSQASMSFGIVSPEGNNISTAGMANRETVDFIADPDRTKPSFDQIGGVLTMKTGSDSYLNFGFNYHKSRNFNQLLSVTGLLDNASQNKLAFMKHWYWKEDKGYNEDYIDKYLNTQTDHLYDWVLNGAVNEVNGKQQLTDHYTQPFDGYAYRTQQVTEGYIGDYDFNISGNIHNRIYLGLTVGVKDVHYSNCTVYEEALSPERNISDVALLDRREIEGTGFDFKFGIIARPIESSPFRIGAYVHTPTWYNLTTYNNTTLFNNLPKEYGNYDSKENFEELDFRLNTPWVFGFSLGHTIGQQLALGATYEYSDYSAMDNRVIDGGHYDYWTDDWVDESSSDRAMNELSDYCLEGVHTLKLGAEYKVIPEVAFRLGYNYVSPKFAVKGYRDQTFESQGNYYASSTDYTNWRATNRVTAGVGLTFGSLTADIAYQYSQTDGEYYPFMSYTSSTAADNCIADMAKVSEKRHQVLLTIGYRF